MVWRLAVDKESSEFKRQFSEHGGRSAWAEKASEVYYADPSRFPSEYSDPSRLGPVTVASLNTDEGLEYWLQPVDGSKIRGILLGPLHEVCCLNRTGEILYRGSWEGLPGSLVADHLEFYLWLEPPRRESVKKSWEVKIPWWSRWYQRARRLARFFFARSFLFL